MSLLKELKWRGFVNQTTFKDPTILDKQKFTFYWGVDPSSDSMTIGNLAAAMMVRHFINHGHKAVLLVGGATGMIGDPDGKNEERELQSAQVIKNNKAAIVAQYKTIFADQPFKLVDNYDWFKKMNYLAFLRDIGKHFSMTQLLQRDFIAKRIGKGGSGISYAEFSYSLIQGYDFLHLFRKHGVTLQVCGADQWGNSLSGVELIRKLEGKAAHIWSAPLIVNKVTGKKFGKSEGGAIWLDSKKTSVFDFYQFWLNIDDDSAIDYLKVFTMLDQKQIVKIIDEFKKEPAKRLVQKTLAYEVTKMVHGKESADKAKNASDELFSNKNISDSMPTIKVRLGKHDDVAQLLVEAKLVKSKSEATRLINQDGVKLNKKKLSGKSVDIAQGDLLQVGKRKFVKLV